MYIIIKYYFLICFIYKLYNSTKIFIYKYYINNKFIRKGYIMYNEIIGLDGKAYKNDYGEYIIIEYMDNKFGKKRVKIRFLKTGYETETELYKAVRNFNIEDRLLPSLCGVGMLGYGGEDAPYKLKNAWGDMIRRCYNKDCDAYKNYGLLGVSVCERWKRRDFFLQDAVNLPGYQDMINNPHITYALDKDKLQQGVPINEKIYSPWTCMWLPLVENNYQVLFDHCNERIVKHIGINLTHGNTYNVRIRNKYTHKKINYGNYDDIDAAIAISNHVFRMKNVDVVNIPEEKEMSVFEAVQHRRYPLNKQPVCFAKVVDDENKYFVKIVK